MVFSDVRADVSAVFYPISQRFLSGEHPSFLWLGILFTGIIRGDSRVITGAVKIVFTDEYRGFPGSAKLFSAEFTGTVFLQARVFGNDIGRSIVI